MRQTLPLGGHHFYDIIVARRLQRFYNRIAKRQPEATTILDVGCGPGHLAAALAAHHPDAQVLGMDLDKRQVRIANRAHQAPNLTYQQGASHALDLATHSQDWVLATETFHHWIDPEGGIQEIFRVLRPGGEFWIIEGAGDMTRDELEAWTGRRPFPGLTWWVRQVFKIHGYTTGALEADVVSAARASAFAGCEVVREDGWWIVKMRKKTEPITLPLGENKFR